MSQINTLPSPVDDLVELDVRPRVVVMVHSSLRQVGWTVGGPVTVIRALLKVLGSEGTLVMPAESPQMSDPAGWNDDRVRPERHSLSEGRKEIRGDRSCESRPNR